MTKQLFSFRHIDESARRIYRSTVLYGFEAPKRCYLLKVRNGYLIEAPPAHNRDNKLGWVRGQHLGTLENYFTKIVPIRIVSDAY